MAQYANPVVAERGRKYSSELVAPGQRKAWLCDVIGREYAEVDIVPPTAAPLYNEMTLYPWQDMQLSVIHSNSLTIQRGTREISSPHLDNYFAVLLLQGRYCLQQQGREVFLQPGDMTIYDATVPHYIHCPEAFSKLIVSIPRNMLHQRLPQAGHMTALPLRMQQGMTAMLSPFLQQLTSQLNQLSMQAFEASAAPVLDMLGASLETLSTGMAPRSRSRSLSLLQIKQWLSKHLQDAELDTHAIAAATGFSSRYMNQLFADEQTSLMRYVWQQRLALSAQYLKQVAWQHHTVTEIALACGFNDFSHFSRAFKQQFGCSPRAFRQQGRETG